MPTESGCLAAPPILTKHIQFSMTLDFLSGHSRSGSSKCPTHGKNQIMNRQKPESVIRIGYVSASIFARTIERKDEPDRIVRSVNLQKRYLDGDEAKFSSSFGLNELPQAITVLQLALDRVAEQEAIVSQSDEQSNASA
jgi:hypothetical protein